jgi:hypothetical protein
VTGNQAQEFTAGIPAGARDRDPDSHTLLLEGLLPGTAAGPTCKSMHCIDYLCKQVSVCGAPARTKRTTGRGGEAEAVGQAGAVGKTSTAVTRVADTFRGRVHVSGRQGKATRYTA